MTDFRTRKKDGQAYPINRKNPHDSGLPQYRGVDISQIKSTKEKKIEGYEPKSMAQFTKGKGKGFVNQLNKRKKGLPSRMKIFSAKNRRKMRKKFIKAIEPKYYSSKSDKKKGITTNFIYSNGKTIRQRINKNKEIISTRTE